MSNKGNGEFMTGRHSLWLRAGNFAMAIIVVGAALLVGSPAAQAWGCQGHEAVALIAQMHLNPRALAMVNQILKDGPIDPALSRYCKETGLTPMADAATWADDIRSVRPDATNWHFIDIPRGASKDEIEKYCEVLMDPASMTPPVSTGCITKALREQIAILRAPDSSPQRRADALRFVIHFVGDIHQPLHDTTNNDRGGNCVPVEYMGIESQLRNPQTESYSPNLHSVWDTNILVTLENGKTVQDFAAELDSSFATRIPGWQAGGADFDAWAWEGHQLAEEVVYGKLPKPIPVEPPIALNDCSGDKNIGSRMFELHEDLEQQYQDVSAPVVRAQIAKAGARLATVLNGIWP
jgi:hypothetical protein